MQRRCLANLYRGADRGDAVHGAKGGLVLRGGHAPLGRGDAALVHVPLAALPPELEASHEGVQELVLEVTEQEGRVGGHEELGVARSERRERHARRNRRVQKHLHRKLLIGISFNSKKKRIRYYKFQGYLFHVCPHGP